MIPQRIQLRRTKGWRKPESAAVVSRPSKWGNPVRIDKPNPVRRAWAAQTYADMVLRGDPRVPSLIVIQAELYGLDLACWCPLDQPCHADVLLELANR